MGFSKRDQARALKTIRDVLSGARGTGRNAAAKLAAARLVLGDESNVVEALAKVSDEQLLAEVSRRGLQAPAVDLDAAERAMEARRDGEQG